MLMLFSLSPVPQYKELEIDKPESMIIYHQMGVAFNKQPIGARIKVIALKENIVQGTFSPSGMVVTQSSLWHLVPVYIGAVCTNTHTYWATHNEMSFCLRQPTYSLLCPPQPK